MLEAEFSYATGSRLHGMHSNPTKPESTMAARQHEPSPLLNRLCQAFLSSLYSGCIFAVLYFFVFFVSVGFVTGEGRAPQFTHFTMWTLEFAFACLGVNVSSGSLFLAMVFWGTGYAAIVFAYKFSAIVIRELRDVPS